MSEFVQVLKLADLPEGTAKQVVVDGKTVAVVHTEGQVFAVSDTCTHAEVSLSEGDIDGCEVECWLHGARFDLRTGEATSLPATKPIATFDVKLEGDSVLVRI